MRKFPGWFLLKLLVTAALVALVWRNIDKVSNVPDVDWSELWESISLGYLALGLFSLWISVLLGARQWQLLLSRQEISPGYLSVLRHYLVGIFFNNFMPGNVGGDVKKVYDIQQETKSRLGAGLSATLFDRLVGFFALNSMALAVWGMFFVHDERARFLMLPSLWIFLGFCVFFMALFSRRFSRLVYRILAWIFPRTMADRFLGLLERFHAYRNIRLLVQVGLLSCITQSLRVSVHWFCGLALGVELSISWYFYLIPMVAMVTALPISVGGFGPRELVAQSLFTMVGVGALQSVLIQILAYWVTLVMSLAGGVIYLLRRSRPRATDALEKSF